MAALDGRSLGAAVPTLPSLVKALRQATECTDFPTTSTMKNVLRLAIVDPTEDSRESLKTSLMGLDYVWLEAECSRYEFFADVVAQTQPDIGIVSLDADASKGIELVARVSETSPECSILVTSSTIDGNLVLQAMRAGAKEFLTQPIALEELVAALERISSQRTERGDSGSRVTKVIAIAGATGGVGCTSIAVNIGCCLASEENLTPALVDLDLCLGDADVLLDTIPEHTLADVSQNISRLDFTLLKRSLTRHSSGLFLLPRPVQLDEVGLITPDDLQRVIGLLKATFTHVILDLSKGFTPLDQMALRLADEILLITQLDLSCLRNSVRLLASFGEIEGVAEKVKVVVNRIGLDGGEIGLKKAHETIGREIFDKLPNDYRTMVESRNNGVPLIEQAPKAKITQAIRRLTYTVGGIQRDDQATAAGSSSLSRLFNLWGSVGVKASPSAESKSS